MGLPEELKKFDKQAKNFYKDVYNTVLTEKMLNKVYPPAPPKNIMFKPFRSSLRMPNTTPLRRVSVKLSAVPKQAEDYTFTVSSSCNTSTLDAWVNFKNKFANDL